MAKRQAKLHGTPIGRGCSYTLKDGVLILQCDLSERAREAAPPSSTGKSKLPVNSGGWVQIPEIPGVRLMVQATCGYEGAALARTPQAATQRENGQNASA